MTDAGGSVRREGEGEVEKMGKDGGGVGFDLI